MTDRELTSEQVQDLLDYDFTTGVFTWRVDFGNRKSGAVAGSKDAHGYIVITINGRAYKAHRLAWLYCHGGWPEHSIDHINGVKDDNRIANLRDVEHPLNLLNVRRAYRTNKSGFLGVSRNGSGWRAEIRVAKKKRNLGTYDTPEQAHAAYLAAKNEILERLA
jgi:hypothetical protein